MQSMAEVWQERFDPKPKEEEVGAPEKNTEE